jgi:hypothetical protein
MPDEPATGQTVTQTTVESSNATGVATPPPKRKTSKEAFKELLSAIANDMTKKESRETYKKAASKGLGFLKATIFSVSNNMGQNFGSPFDVTEQFPMTKPPIYKPRKPRRRTRRRVRG